MGFQFEPRGNLDRRGKLSPGETLWAAAHRPIKPEEVFPMGNAIDPKSIKKIILGKTCPKCPNESVYGSHRAAPHNQGRQVVLANENSGRRELVDIDWESYVRQKLHEGFVPSPNDPGALINRRELQRWMSSACCEEVCDPTVVQVRHLLETYFGPYLLLLSLLSILSWFLLAQPLLD